MALPEETLLDILRRVKSTVGASSLVSCLLSCRKWRDSGLYSNVYLTNSNLEALTEHKIRPLDDPVKPLTVTLDPVKPATGSMALHPKAYLKDTIHLKSNGSQKTEILWALLQRLPGSCLNIDGDTQVTISSRRPEIPAMR